MATETLTLSPKVIEWAAKRAGVPLDDVANKVSRRPQRILEGQMTLGQAEKFATLTNLPLGYLFLRDVPAQRDIPLPDFRSIQDREPLGIDFFDVFDDIQYKQQWFRDYLIEVGANELSFVGSVAPGATPEKVATAISDTLQLDRERMRTAGSPESLYSYLAQCSESAGMLVFKNGVVGSNNSRPLSVSQFRGFAIADPFCPAIFINGADAGAAWAFTLLHEVAHIALGQSAITDSSPKSSNTTEALCNAAAAEVLVPKVDFLREWGRQRGEPETKLETLRLYFKVSKVVVARRALDARFIDYATYSRIYALARRAASSSGGDFYATLGTRNGKKFSSTVSELAYSGELGLRHAARLLNTSPSNVLNYYERRAIPA